MPRPIEECIRLFESLPPEIGLKLLRKAGRASAEILQEEIGKRAPVETGHLKSNILIRTKKESEEEIAINIGPAKSAYYGIFSEFGTAFETKKPFMQPAVEDKFPQAAELFGQELAKAVDKHFK